MDRYMRIMTLCLAVLLILPGAGAWASSHDRGGHKAGERTAGSVHDLKGDYSKMHIHGTVKSIDMKAKTFTITEEGGQQVMINVNPATEFELEKGKGVRHGKEDDIPFSELKTGDWVKVKCYSRGEKIFAKDVDVYR